MRRFGIDPFVLALLAAIGSAWVAPGVGVAHPGWLPVDLAQLAGWAVGAIFFFYGLKLDPGRWRAGLSNYRLHILIHGATFLLFPLLVLGVMAVFPHWRDDHYLWVGLFFMAALPSTVSSAVVMVSLAGGNVPAAIFNASLSSLLGIVITPLWVSLFLAAGPQAAGLGSVALALLMQVVAPILMGMLLRRWWGAWADRHSRALAVFDQAVIVAIVYTSFCASFAGGLFGGISWGTIGGLIAGLGGLFWVVYGLLFWTSKRLRFSREDTITATFCGSKKSLVHGTVMARVLVPDQTLTGLVLLPVMIYHALQLALVGMLVAGLRSRKKS